MGLERKRAAETHGPSERAGFIDAPLTEPSPKMQSVSVKPIANGASVFP